MKKISSHFSKSVSSKEKFKNLQERFFEDSTGKAYQIPKYFSTRWTSLFRAIHRIFNVWESLEHCVVENPDVDFEGLTEENRVFLELLRCLLDKLNGLVVYFEQENFDYAYIIPKLQRTYKFWGQYILKEEF